MNRGRLEEQRDADDRLTAYVNGKNIGSHNHWKTPQRYDIAPLLRAGRNVLAVEAENVAAPAKANSAGLLCAGEVVCSDGTHVSLASNATWKSSNVQKDGWTRVDFPDDGWPAAKVAARYGQPPWNTIGAPDTSVPLAVAGIPGQVRVIYVPNALPLRVNHLERDLAWRAEYFDPVTGRSTDLLSPTIDADGSCRVAPPANAPDWVLVLQRKDAAH